jgi:hypothetical protein
VNDFNATPNRGYSMSDVIDVLERMGRDSHWSFAPSNEIEQALLVAQIDQDLRNAIVAGNQQELEALLGQKPLCAMLQPGEEDDEEDDDEQENPSREGDHETTLQSVNVVPT